MDNILAFARGPLFRLSFAIMVLGLLRIFILDLWGMARAYHKAGDKKIPWGATIGKSLGWLVPVKRVFNNRPVYSIFSILFHVGLLLVPIFLFAHIELWRKAIGFGWPSLPQVWADVMTITTIVFALLLFFARIISKSSSFLSRKQDYLWPLVLIAPFVTGFICSNLVISPEAYQFCMLVHILSGELIFILIPFTKIAHCVLMPLSQFVSTLAWKFPPETDEPISITLNKKGTPV